MAEDNRGEVTYLNDADVRRRLGVFAGEVLGRTQHGWPVGIYTGDRDRVEALQIVNMLVDAHLDPPIPKPGESAEEFKDRKKAAKGEVHAQLDEAELAFMEADDGDSSPEDIDERFIRFGGQAADQTRERAMFDARRYLVMTGRLKDPDVEIDDLADDSSSFTLLVDPAAVNAVLDQARQRHEGRGISSNALTTVMYALSRISNSLQGLTKPSK